MKLTQLKNANAKQSQTAFTMLEILIAVAIMVVTFVSLYLTLSGGFAIIQTTREDLRATQVLQEKMETIRLYTWDQVTNVGFVPTNFTAPFYAANLTNANGSAGYSGLSGLTYTGSVAIGMSSVTNASYSNDLRQVSISLSWVSGNRVRTRTVSTLISHYGLQNYIYF